jgi:hypothetical protein
MTNRRIVKKSPTPPKRRAKIGISAALIIVVSLAVWWFIGSGAPARPPEIEGPLAEMQNLQQLAPDKRGEKFREIREQVSQLSPEAQRAFRREIGKQRAAEMNNRMNAFLTAPTPAARKKVLDQHINEMEKMRAQRESRQRSGGQQIAQASGGRPQTGDGPPRGGRRGNFQDRLDRSSPEERAKRSEYFRALRERRKELGLPENPWPRPRV